jgi:signal transduction histidine kinase
MEKVTHIKGIINAQQAYARQATFREDVHVAQLVREVLKMHAPSLRKHEIVVREDLAMAPRVSVEKSKLLQVIDNLVKNAAESIVQAEAAKREISVSARASDNDTVVIKVSDTGMGILEENSENIFQYGYTTKPSGNGFGLHASALAMSNLGGRISVESRGAYKGATFLVEFPLERTLVAPAGGDGDALQEACSLSV